MPILEAGTSYMQRLSGAEMVMPAQDNLQWVLDRKVNYMDAMYRPDLGWISFLWGREGSRSSDYMDGWGIANILAKDAHNTSTTDTLMQAVEALARGRIKRKYGPPGNRRVEILWQGFIARLAWSRGRKTWYLAGWPGLVAEDPEEEQVTESAKIDREADKAATSPKNDEPQPTEAQKESGNYKKGHVKILGLDIAIENPKGSERSGIDGNGKKWTSKMHHHYGYIKGTVGRDKDHIDVFLGPDPEGADKVFVVNQVSPETGGFDEHKCLVGFETEKEAKDAYLSNYEKGWKGLGSMAEMTVDDFKDWLKDGDTKKPVDQVLEAAKPFDWRTAIQDAKSIDDIEAVFRRVFADGYEGKGKEPWQMTKAEFIQAHRDRFIRERGKQRLQGVLSADGSTVYPLNSTDHKRGQLTRPIEEILSDIHKGEVKGRIQQNQRAALPNALPYEKVREIPKEVLADYPDLKPKDPLPPLKQPGEKLSVMGEMSEVVDAQRLNDVDYELFRGESGPGYVFAIDTETQQMYAGKKFPKFEDAFQAHVENVKANGGVVPELPESQDIPTDIPEFTRFKQAMQEKYGGAGWMLGAAPEDYEKYKQLEAELPTELKKLYSQKHGKKPMVLKMQTPRPMGVMIAPSSKEPGHTQATYFDKDGFSGDRQYKTEAEAIREEYKEGYTEFDPDWLEELTITDDFIAGNEKTREVERENEKTAKGIAIRNLISDMRALVDLPENRPQDIPENWIIMNAPRPLVGDKEWQGEFRHGIFYAAIDPENDEPPGVEWRIQSNKDLDAWVARYVTTDVVEAAVRNRIAGQKYYKNKPEIIEEMMQNKDAVRQSFFNSVENKTVAEVDEILNSVAMKGKGIMESAIYEMAMGPHEVDHSNWAYAIETAEDTDDISNIFKVLFGAPTDAGASPYFESTAKSLVIPIDKLVRRETPDPKRLEHAKEYMKAAKKGTGTKRKPISILAMGNGKYKVLDGNTTLQALKDLGEEKVVVEIKKTLKQPGVKTIEDLYEQADEGFPQFKEMMEKWAARTGGRIMIRPGLKSKERATEKCMNDEKGHWENMKDIIAGTLVFDTVEEVRDALRIIEHDDPIFRIKNRYEKPMPTGYRDIFMNVAMPNGHIAELQLNTQTMIDAKEKGIGHKIYEVTRTLEPIARKGEGDMRFIARGVIEEANDVSRKLYNDAAARSSSSRAAAKDLASASDITDAWDLILTQLSGSSIKNHVSLETPSIRNSSQESLSNANGRSSFSKNSTAMSFPPSDDVTENLTEALKEVKHIVGNPATAYLFDNTPVRVQYAIVEIGDMKTSHDDSMGLSPDYPQEVQPRQRERGAMQLQIKEMANKLNPERMAASPQASTGAPIVGPDLAVESGNGRTMALRHAYQTGEKGKEYREWLIQHANEFGMPGTDVAAMKQPVLVRMRVGKVNDRAQFARDANKDELAQMSPVEIAKMDATTLTETDLSLFAPSEDGNIGASSNTAFVNRFVQRLGVNESAGYLTADGRPTKQLIDRIQAAIFQKAYQDESVLALVAEETNPDLRNILNGLTFAAKDFVQARAFTDDFDGIDITKHAIAAGRLVRKSRNDNVVIEEVLGQAGLFSDIPEGTAVFARFIDKHIRSAKRIGRVLQVAADILKDHLSMRDQAALFDKPEPPTEAEIIQRAVAQVEEEYADKNKSLFESGGESFMQKENIVLEKAEAVEWVTPIKLAKTLDDIRDVFVRLFGPAVMKIKKSLTDYKDDENSDYGLKVKGIKAREALNEQAREIIARVDDPGKLTQEEIGILKQYSGKGGLTENSQYEYYTPTHVAEGLWDGMRANGFENGNILDPCTGAGVFEGTKPKGAIMTGCDLDPTGSKIAQLLNPTDTIQTKPFEQLVMETPDNTFDGCITNVPFGDARGACAHDDPAYKTEKRIERYFILRALDKIKPGKLACFVVNTSVVGAKGGKWTEFRTAVSKKAEFLGAHKLPSKTFGGRGGQGTDAVTDIVIFKKHPEDLLEKIDSLHLETLKAANVLWDEFIQGQYWQGEGRKFIMGTYVPKVEGDRWSRESVDGDIDNEAMKRKLAQRFNTRIDWDALEVAEPVVKNYADGDRRVINGEEYEMQAGDWLKVHKGASVDDMVLEAAKYGAASYGELESLLASPKGALRLTADQAFAVWKAYPNVMSPLQSGAIEFAMSQPKTELIEQLWRGSIIGGMIDHLRVAETDNDPDGDVEAMRQELQELVVAEVKKYGHPKNNKGLMITGEGSRSFGLFMNAMDVTGNFSDLLSGNITQDAMQFDATSIQAIVEHLFLREGIQNIELEDIQKLYAGKRKIESLGDIADDDGIALTPDGMIMPWTRYCSGDIYPKLRDMTHAMADETDARIKTKYQKQIDEIMRKRQVTAPEDISFDLRNKWYGRQYLIEFLRANGYPRIAFGKTRHVPVEDDAGMPTGETRLEFVEDPDAIDGEWVGISQQGSWHKALEQYLNGKSITHKLKKDEYKTEFPLRLGALADAFNGHMMQHPDAPLLYEKFNQKFNGWLPFEHDDSPLNLENVSPQVKLHPYQAASVRRMSEEGRGCLALDVGLGKTKSALALHALNLQMGRTKRTCVVVPNAVVANWYHEARQFFPDNSRTMVIGVGPKLKKDGTIEREMRLDEYGQPKKNRHTGEVEYQDVLKPRNDRDDVYDDLWKLVTDRSINMVIMSKDRFKQIPIRKESKERLTGKLVDHALLSAKTAKETNEKNNPTDQARHTYQDDVNLIAIQQKYGAEGSNKTKEFPFFEDLGITDIIVDECHEFKNSYEGSADIDRIAYLPIAGSAGRAIDMSLKTSLLREQNNGRGVYTMSATPVTNSPLEIFNILSLVCPFEEFEALGIYTVDDFVRVFGRVEPVDKTKVSGEVANVDGLTGFQNLDGLRNLFHKYVNMKTAHDPDVTDFVKLPPYELHNEFVEMTEDQEAVYANLREDAVEAATPGSKLSMFTVMRNMDRVTTDMDLYRHTMTFHFAAKDKAKIDALIEQLPPEMTIQIVEDKQKVDQVVPLDAKTRTEGDTYIMVVPECYEDLVVSLFPQMGIKEEEVGHPLTPKYALLIERLRKHFEENGKQLIFTEEKSQHQKLKRLLTHEVPLWADVIGVINGETAKGEKLQEIANLYNSGKHKIIIANRKAEVGVNLQKGTTAIHHLTLPWTPASMQQRDGRGLRQGNTAAKVEIYHYLAQGSFDLYRLDLLRAKSNWMQDLFRGNDATAENANALTNDDFIDMLSDDPEAAKIKRLEALAQKAAERQKKQDKLASSTLSQITLNAQQLASLDTKKAEENAKLNEKIPEYEKKIERYKKRISEATDPEVKEALEASLGVTERGLKNAKIALKSIDERYEDARKSLETRIEQAKSTLKFKAKKGNLPFDESLIDHPENALVSFDGTVVAKGDCYEVIPADDNDHAASNLRRRYGGQVIQITEVNPVEKWLQFDSILEDRYIDIPTEYKNGNRVTPIAIWPSKDLKKVSYSADEIAVKKILSQSFSYEDLIEGKISKDLFHDHLNEIQFSAYNNCVIRTPTGFGFSEFGDVEDRKTIVYPDPQNEDFRKGVCEAYLALNREDDAGYHIMTLMRALFGDQWRDTAMSYGKTATESQVREAFAKVIQEYRKNNIGDLSSLEDRKHYLSVLQSDQYELQDRIIKDLAVDNDVRKIVQTCFDVEYDENYRDVKILEKEAEQKALEELKSDPNYKEVPANIAEAFQKLGITVKTNMTQMVIPGWKRIKAETVPPFKKWYFQDVKGKSGPLFRASAFMKSRYKAGFFSNADDVFRGAWWHIPSSVDLKEVYELIA